MQPAALCRRLAIRSLAALWILVDSWLHCGFDFKNDTIGATYLLEVTIEAQAVAVDMIVFQFYQDVTDRRDL